MVTIVMLYGSLRSEVSAEHPTAVWQAGSARWGMAVQELDVTILHRVGKQNANADALSQSPLPDSSPTPCIPFGIVAAMDKEEDLKRKDPSLMEIIDMMETGVRCLRIPGEPSSWH